MLKILYIAINVIILPFLSKHSREYISINKFMYYITMKDLEAKLHLCRKV